jgi:molecular chaperone GrpE (heat shock protein)
MMVALAFLFRHEENMAKNKQGQEGTEPSKEAPPLTQQAQDEIKAGAAELDQTEIALLRDENEHLRGSIATQQEEVAALRSLLDEARRPSVHAAIEKRFPGVLEKLDGLFNGEESYGALPSEAMADVEYVYGQLKLLLGAVHAMRTRMQEHEILEMQAKEASMVAERPTLRVTKDIPHSVGGGMTVLRAGANISARTYGVDMYDRLRAHMERSFPQNFVVVASKPAT